MNGLLSVLGYTHDVLNKLTVEFTPEYYKRPMIEFVRSQNKKNLDGVELGVCRGYNALYMLRVLDLHYLWLVDPYAPYVDDKQGRVSDYSGIYEGVKKRFSMYSNVCLVHGSSVDAVDRIRTVLDFVYIDGDHSYENVKLDILLYYPLVGHGCVLGGHDYSGQHRGVIRAVDEFVDAYGLELCTGDLDWWVVKK